MRPTLCLAERCCLVRSFPQLLASTLDVVVRYVPAARPNLPYSFDEALRAAISIFFLSMRDTHTIMLKLKKQELAIARQHLATLHDKLVEESDNVQAEVLIKMAPTTNAWLTYEKRIDQAPEWPFTSPMLRKLLVSVLIPITLFILQRVANEFLAQLLVKK